MNRQSRIIEGFTTPPRGTANTQTTNNDGYLTPIRAPVNNENIFNAPVRYQSPNDGYTTPITGQSQANLALREVTMQLFQEENDVVQQNHTIVTPDRPLNTNSFVLPIPFPVPHQDANIIPQENNIFLDAMNNNNIVISNTIFERARATLANVLGVRNGAVDEDSEGDYDTVMLLGGDDDSVNSDITMDILYQ